MSSPIPELLNIEPEAPPNQENQSHRRGGNRDRGSRRRGGGGGPHNRGGRFRNFDQQRRPPFPGGGRAGGSRQVDAPAGGGEDEKDYRFPDRVFEKLAQISGPTVELPVLNTEEKKFSGRNRLYVGNISAEATEDDLKELLSKFGETGDLFYNKDKMFAFVKFDSYATAVQTRDELDGVTFKKKALRIRFAQSNACIKVKNLSPFVSNELLTYAFQVFGEVERAYILVDERGKSTGEGIVEFTRKGFALSAMRYCTERCFFLTQSLQPCLVEPYEPINQEGGYPEKYLPKRNPEFLRARSQGPRLADFKSFEHEYGMRWKQLITLYAQKEEALKKELDMEKEKLEAQLEYAK